MKTKSAQSLVTGLMWLQQNVQYGNNLPLRHACDQGNWEVAVVVMQNL